MSRADFNKVHLDYGAYGFEPRSERVTWNFTREERPIARPPRVCRLRLHGTSGRYGNQLRLKKSYRMLFPQRLFSDRKLDFRPFPGISSVLCAFGQVLRASPTMRSDQRPRHLIRDQLLRELHEDMRCPRAWYNLFVNDLPRRLQPGGENRKNFLSSVFPEEGENWDVWNGEAVDGDGTSWNEPLEFFLEGDLSNEALYERALELVNIEDFTAYIILHIWAQNHDWPHKNWIAVRPRRSGARWRFLTWDPPLASTRPTSPTRLIAREPIGSGGDLLEPDEKSALPELFSERAGPASRGCFAPGERPVPYRRHKRLLAHDIRRDLKLPLIERPFEAWEANVSFLEEFARNRGPVIRDWIVNDPRAASRRETGTRQG